MLGTLLQDRTVLTAIWQPTALLLGGLAVSYILRARPARAHAALFVAMVGLLATPLASLVVSGLGFGLLPPHAVPWGGDTASDFAPPRTIVDRLATSQEAVAPARSVSTDAAIVPTSKFVVASSTPPRATRSSPWPGVSAVLLTVWGLLTGALATKMLFDVWQARRLLVRHRPIAEPHLRECLDEAALRLGLSVAPALGAAAIRSPVVWCWGRRPTVLVPESAGGTGVVVDWVGVFCHELAHFRRADHMTDILAQLVTVLLPWQPLAWWARRRLHELSEQACDVWAVADGRSPLVYAESLLHLQPQRRPGLAMAAVSSRSLLVARVERLLRLKPGNPRAGGVWIATTWLAGVLATAGVALAQVAPRQAANDATEQDGHPAGAGGHMRVSGKVMLATGNVAHGARVAVVGRSKRPTRSGDLADGQPEVLGLTAADDQGRFELEVRRTSSAEFWDLFALAVLPGHAMGLQPLNADAERPTAEIVLPDEQTVRGRLVDLQGEPAAGVPVHLSWVANKSDWRGETGIQFWYPPKHLPLWPEPVKTDDQGRFVVGNVGRDHDLSLQIRDPRFALQMFTVDRKHESADHELLFTVAPAQIVEGVVTYADTGRPAARARLTIYAGENEHGGGTGMSAEADEQGRFKLNPFPGAFFDVTAYDADGEPYLNVHKDIEWPKGARRHLVDLALPRGVLVRGRLVEAGDGRPVAGAGVQYVPRSNNAHVTPEIVTGRQDMTVSGKDGTFRMAVPPGAGHLLVKGPAGDHVHHEMGERELQFGRPGGTRFYPDAVVALDIPEGTQTHDVEATMTRGVTVHGRLIGPDGQAVDKAIMVCKLNLSPHEFYWRFGQEIAGGRFELHGCDPDASYHVMFLDSEHEWGATATIDGRAARDEPLLVQLSPCGTASVRFVGKDKKPLQKFNFQPELVVTPGASRYDMKAYEQGSLAADSNFFGNIDRRHYWNGPKTDEQGRVTYPALIPGATYRIAAGGAGELREFVAISGKNIELADVDLDIGQ